MSIIIMVESVSVIIHMYMHIQLPLGTLPKCETSHEDMIAIMEHLQQYVPLETVSSTINVKGIGEKEVLNDHFHHVLLGGHLNVPEEASMSGATQRERLEGLKPVIEDWHAKVCLLGVSTCTLLSLI